MLPNRGPWPTFPPQNFPYPYYYPGSYYPTYNGANHVPPSAPYASGLGSSPVTPSTPYAPGPSSSPVITPLASNAFRPAGTAGPAPVTPSPGFPLPQRSPTIQISNPNTGESFVTRLQVPVNAAEVAGVGGPTPHERPLTKKERKMKAKLEAEEKKRAEEVKAARKEAEEAERLRKAEVEESKREEEEVRMLEQELRKLEEDMRKEEEELKKWEAERKEAEEDVRKLEEQHRIQQDKTERARKEREKAKVEEERRHRLAEETNAVFQANNQEKAPPKGLPASSSLERSGAEHRNELIKVDDPSARQTGRAQARRLGLAFAPSAFANAGFDTPPDMHDSSITRERSQDQDTQPWYIDDLAEEQKNSGEPAAEVASHHTLDAILELSKQMEMLLQEMKDLKDEVRELRSEARSGDGRGRSKRKGSAPTVRRTATAINQYFIMKKGELDFCPGDVINILEAPQDTPRGWMYGEINITKRGFFPGAATPTPFTIHSEILT
ncbi:hypothetical protein FS837_006820 [Tulasnella sp. UAMH 9824]|nr:hypothetical protein FS837_006820 [Tulasnella sp. UAMH 9824]